MVELGGWGVVAVLVGGLLVVTTLIRMARRRLRRRLASLAIAAVLTGYGGAGLLSLDLGGFLSPLTGAADTVTEQVGGQGLSELTDQFSDSDNRCARLAGTEMSLGDAPAHGICAIERRLASVTSVLPDLPF